MTPTDFRCLFCYLSKGDTVEDMITNYTIGDNFDVYKMDKKIRKREKHLIPTINNSIKNMYLNNYNYIINGKKYNFLENNIRFSKKLGKEMAKDIATRYINDSEYRKYIDERLERDNQYDFKGRKINTDIKSIGKWKVIKYLSTGTFGATYIVTKKTKEYVLKTFHTKKGVRSQKAVEKECNITKLAGKLGVGPKVIDCSSNIPQYIVMEKLDGPSIGERYSKYIDIPKSDLEKLQKKIKILDSNHIKHNDIHLGNVLYHKDRVYIIDYGMANIVKAKVTNKIIFRIF